MQKTWHNDGLLETGKEKDLIERKPKLSQ
jgi:hypothetical protein